MSDRHTQEYHQALLDVWHTGDRGFFPHKYRRCGFSGAGNCCCGRDDRSPLHTIAALAEGADERRKVPGVPDDLDELRARTNRRRDASAGVAWARPEGATNTAPASDPPLDYTERGMP